MWELDYKESWVPKNWWFWTVVLEQILESPLDYKEIQPVHPKGDQSWVFIGRIDAEAKAPILQPPNALSSVTKSCSSLDYPRDCRTPGFSVLHQLPEITQTHVHWVGDAIQPFRPLPSPSSAAFNLSQHQGLFQWVSSSHQVSKVLQCQLQYQSFQWILRTDFL